MSSKYVTVDVALQLKTQTAAMYIVVIGWLYVALMMAVAEATSSTGSVLGAIVTFLLYGVGPVGLVVYLMLEPARRRRRKAARLAVQQAGAVGSQNSEKPDAGGEAPADAVAPVRKEP